MFVFKKRRAPDSFGTLPQIRAGAAADDPATRGNALQALFAYVQRDRTIHAEAVVIYREALVQRRDPWTVVNAILGLDAIVGAEANRSTWLEFLADQQPAEFVEMVMWSVTDPSLGDRMLEILAQRPEPGLRRAAVRAVGKLRPPSARFVLESALMNPDLRPGAIMALADVGDAAAIRA